MDIFIRLEPIPLTKVWGGEKLSKLYSISQTNIGEIWGISAHKSISNIIINGIYKGMTLSDFYLQYRVHFGNYTSKEFPDKNP